MDTPGSRPKRLVLKYDWISGECGHSMAKTGLPRTACTVFPIGERARLGIVFALSEIPRATCRKDARQRKKVGCHLPR